MPNPIAADQGPPLQIGFSAPYKHWAMPCQTRCVSVIIFEQSLPIRNQWSVKCVLVVSEMKQGSRCVSVVTFERSRFIRNTRSARCSNCVWTKTGVKMRKCCHFRAIAFDQKLMICEICIGCVWAETGVKMRKCYHFRAISFYQKHTICKMF